MQYRMRRERAGRGEQEGVIVAGATCKDLYFIARFDKSLGQHSGGVLGTTKYIESVPRSYKGELHYELTF